MMVDERCVQPSRNISSDRSIEVLIAGECSPCRAQLLVNELKADPTIRGQNSRIKDEARGRSHHRSPASSVVSAGTSRVTTARAPTTELLCTVTPRRTSACAAIHT